MLYDKDDVLLLFTYMDVLLSCIFVYHRLFRVPMEAKRGHGCSGSGVTEGSVLSCGCWKSNPGSPEVKPELLTAELFLQPRFHSRF